MALRRVRMDLARDHDFPSGSREHGYDFIAPLDDAGHLLLDEWKQHRERCRVRRYWAGEPDEIGHLVHKRGGPGGTWAFDYKPGTEADDEPGFKLDRHHIVPGEYISIREHDGVMRTFFIRAVTELD